MTPSEGVTASRNMTAPTLLEATANHPVLTATGRKPLGKVQIGETLYRYEAGQLTAYQVVHRQENSRSVKTVYTISTERGAFVVDGAVVLDK
jgi:hypothetical protein